VKINDRIFIIEAKTNIPWGGSAFRRLIGQIRTFSSAAEAQAAGAEVIVVSEGAFTEAALTRVITALGGEASPSIVHGVSELVNVIRMLTLGI
jgi:hypothetical protein